MSLAAETGRIANQLLVVSHVVHYQQGNQLHAYAPYAREIEIWADLFEQVTIAAPCRTSPPPGDSAHLDRANITLWPLPETGGATSRAKFAQALRLPHVILRLVRAMRTAGAIHVRCPGNVGLLGAILAPLFTKYRVAKYAGQWSAYPGEPWTYRLQRWILRSPWWGAPVTVYGAWPNQPGHVIPFFTSVLTPDQVHQAQHSASTRAWHHPLRILFVGRLTHPKNVHVLLAALRQLAAAGSIAHLTIVGDGPERPQLERQASSQLPPGTVTFAGAQPFEAVLQHYEQNDVLVLASESEGWPKVLAEAMAFGLVCIGSNRGLVPHMLGQCRGLIVEPGEPAAVSAALRHIAQAPGQYEPMRLAAAAWAQQFSLDGLRDALAALLREHWGHDAGAPARPAVPP
jgi:glycosyltransferase involved in cell wall biosynthesis